MIKIENSIRVMAGVVALLIMAPPSAVAQEKKHAAVALEKHAAPAQASKRAVAGKPHHLILQVNSNEPAMMNLALNNATNVVQYYKDLGENVKIDVVTFGPACICCVTTPRRSRRGSRRSRRARHQSPSKPAAIRGKIWAGRKVKKF